MVKIVSTQMASDEAALENERIIKAALRIISTISHELRTPLMAISMGAAGAKDDFLALVEGYKLAQKHHLEGLVPIAPRYLEMFSKLFDSIERRVGSCNFYINSVLYNVGPKLLDRDAACVQKISDCIDEALIKYPFSQTEQSLIYWNEQNDFSFWGSKAPVQYLLFNLLRNALSQIKKVGKGEIHVWQESDVGSNILHFKDTAGGIAKDILPKLFQPFNTDKQHGLGLGLVFCSQVMHKLGGYMECHSIEGETCEFLLYFPKVK